jgi:hypothetical protein
LDVHPAYHHAPASEFGTWAGKPKMTCDTCSKKHTEAVNAWGGYKANNDKVNASGGGKASQAAYAARLRDARTEQARATHGGRPTPSWASRRSRWSS